MTKLSESHSSEAIKQFLCQNDGLDLLRMDLHQRERQEQWNWHGLAQKETLDGLKNWQRLVHLHPTQWESDLLSDVASQAALRLIEAGFNSAHAIALLPEKEFVARYQRLGIGGNDQDAALGLYQRAVHSAAQAQHLWGRIKDTVASRQYRTTRFANIRPEVIEYYQSIPSYPDLFGSQDYCACAECRSMLSPAAYFVDIMRITDAYISTPNAKTIPSGYTLAERQPLLFSMLLTCENTNTLIPYLQIVNDSLQAVLAKESRDIFQTLASARYPFNLPFNLHLQAVREYLARLQSSLFVLYQTFEIEKSNVLPYPHNEQVWREYLRLSQTEARYLLSQPQPVSPAAIEPFYGYVAPDTISKHLPFVGQGTVNIQSGLTSLTGNGTVFQQEIVVGDQILLQNAPNPFNVERTVISIDPSKQTLQVADAWTANASTITFIIKPQKSLSDVEYFLDRTRLSYEQLNALFQQQLSPMELAAGDKNPANSFFINRTGQKLPYLHTQLDTQNPSSVNDEIVGLLGIATPANLTRLDHLNRFIRLAQSLGWSYADLDWALVSLQAGDISDETLTQLGKIQYVHSITGLPIDVLCSFWSDMKYIGKVNDANPQDVFDRIFNNPALLAGQNPYTDLLVPFNPTIVLNWDIADESSPTQVMIRSRLLAALGVRDDDLTKAALYLLHILGVDGTQLALSLHNLTWLYRLTRIPALLKLSLDEYFVLLCLLYYPAQCRDTIGTCYLTPPAGAVPATLDALLAQIQMVSQLKASSLGLYDLLYILTGTIVRPLASPYSSTEVVAFLQSLSADASEAFVQADTFLSDLFDESVSSALFVRLINAQVITDHGIVNPQNVTYDSISHMFVLCSTALVTNDITQEEATQAFTLLETHSLLIATTLKDCAQAGRLSITFTPESSLDFLFVGDRQASLKRGQIKAILLRVRSELVQTLQVVADARQLQQDYTINGLSAFLKTTPAILDALFPFLTRTIDPDAYLRDLLTPTTTPWKVVLTLLAACSRAVFLAQKVHLTPEHILAVIAGPTHFGIRDLTHPTLADIQTLVVFTRLVSSLHDTHNTLICGYFQINTTISCDSTIRSMTPVENLAALTGWNAEQIGKLLSVFYPDNKGASTVASLVRLKQAFDLGSLMGADIYLLLQLSALSQLDDSTDWGTFKQLAQASLALVSSKYGQEQFPPIETSLRQRLNAVKRDHLLWFALWYIQRSDASIQRPSDLYQYLLIDVEMGDAEMTSLISQGIASVQLYIQRCRMMLETGVTNLNAIHNPWWEWMMSYRVWEVNRKVFLFPENYLDPSLRPDASPLFHTLKDNLLQTNLDEASIEQVFQDYFAELEVVSSLKYVEGYNTFTFADDPKGGDTAYIFGRTPTQPYTYYYRSYQRKYNKWSPWHLMELSINAPTVASVYAFNRVFIFWVEPQTLTTSEILGSTNNVQTTLQYSDRATLKFSYLQQNQQWLQPQTISDNFVVNMRPDAYLQNITAIAANFDANNLYWQTIYPLHVLPKNNTNTLPKKEQIMLNYGLSIGFTRTNAIPITKPPVTNNPDLATLNERIYAYVQRLNEYLTKTPSGFSGSVLYNVSYISNNLATSVQTTTLFNPISENSPYAPIVAANAVAPVLGIVNTQNPLYDNYYANTRANQPPKNVTPALTLLYNLPGGTSVTMIKNQPGWFLVDTGDEVFLTISLDTTLAKITEELLTLTNRPLLQLPAGDITISCDHISGEPKQVKKLGGFNFDFIRLTTATVADLKARLVMGGIDNLLTIASQQIPELPFGRFYNAGVRPPNTNPPASNTLDFQGAYGLYFWEIFFLAPFLLADTLAQHNQFERARKWYQYIFNPTQPPDEHLSNPNDRYWRFLPLRSLSLDSMVQDLSNPKQIAAYNDDPFNPYAIADLRPTAYQKAIVMKYIDNLLKWGDALFIQDTRESLTQATNLYVLAIDLLGPRPRDRGDCDTVPPVSFNDIKKKYPDGIPQFVIDLENVLISQQSSTTNDVALFRTLPINYLAGAYFCVPENQEFLSYWNLVEDRLYKLRHGMNIQGVERSLALFAPPSAVDQYGRGGAQGTQNQLVSGSGLLPLYRFPFLLGKARDMAASVIELGAAMLSALEKRDAEALATLLNAQEKSLLGMTTLIKEDQVNQLLYSQQALQESLNNAQYRSTYYSTLLNNGLSPSEILNIAAMIKANLFSTLGGTMKTLASLGYLIPNVGSPFAMTYGGTQIGASIDAVGSFFDLNGMLYNFIAGLSQTMAIYERRSQDWQLQADIAQYDIAQIQAEIQSARVQQSIAERDYALHLVTITQNQERSDFYREKFTNQELYQWMAGVLSNLYFQTYTLAFEAAQSAQSAYQSEMNTHAIFVKPTLWNSLYKGLLAGEGLALVLNQMDKLYTESNVRKLEIQKTISLLRLDPKALLDLTQTGECLFQFPEKLFDYDFPGHYARKIKTISVSIPALVGPYENIKATLTQISNQTVLHTNDPAMALNAVNFLLNGSDASAPSSDVLRSNWWINQQIALSTGMNDAGLFEMNFQDERYLPFEGTGAVSTWRLSMPLATNRLDFSTISDVLIQLRYTARDGGNAFRQAVIGLPALQTFAGTLLIPFKERFSQAWYTFLHTQTSENTQNLLFSLPTSIIPLHLKPGARLKGIYFQLQVPTDVSAVSSKKYITFQIKGLDPISFDLTTSNDQTIAIDVALDSLSQPLEIVFNLQSGYTPDCLRTHTSGPLSSDIVQNILLILFYEGEVNWGA